MKIFFLFILLLSSVVSADPTTPSTPSRDQLSSAYALAYGWLGIGIPDKPPHIYPVSKATLYELVNCQQCPVKAVQIGDSIFYDETMNFSDPLDSSVLAHEMAHYVQWWKKGKAKTCEEKMEREWEAYKFQSHILDQIDIKFIIPQNMLIKCI